jgi:haloalkane dehalogenase
MRRRDLLVGAGRLLGAAGLIGATGLAEAAGPVETRAESRASGPSSPVRQSSDAVAARWYEAERQHADTSFGKIAYIERGSGPVALFLHGFPLSSFQWRGCIELLLPHRRCVAPDWMGLGRTEVAPGQSITPTAQADMIAAFLDRLAIEHADLIANDSGGAVAQLFVTRHPERVKSLLLTNCDVETDSPPAALLPVIELARAGIYPDLWLEPWLNHKDVARSPTGLGGMCYSNPAHPSDAALEQYLAPLVESPERKALVNHYALALAPNSLHGIEAQLRKCTAPTRVVWGMSDTIFSPRSPEYLAGILPRFAGIRRIQRGKLFFPEEYPDILAEEALRLWNLTERA